MDRFAVVQLLQIHTSLNNFALCGLISGDLLRFPLFPCYLCPLPCYSVFSNNPFTLT
jgi:hypothetical protein